MLQYDVRHVIGVTAFLLTSTLLSWQEYSHLRDKETEAQTGHMGNQLALTDPLC